MDSDEVRTLAGVEPNQNVTIEGYPEDDTSRWHVNTVPRVGTAENLTVTPVMQAADGSEHWLVAFLDREGKGSWELDRLVAFEGHPPGGVDVEDHGTELNSNDVSIVDIDG